MLNCKYFCYLSFFPLYCSKGPPPLQRLLCTCDHGNTNRLADAETIFALSSGHGRCGVAVVRVSGPASLSALRSMAGLKHTPPPPRTALLRSITDPRTKEVLDRGLVLWFPGNVAGMRPAEAGEFTRRAFQAGKLGLTEVEGLGDLIHAETEAQRRQALRQMSGDLGRLYQDWSSRLKRNLAHVEAFIDFSEDELIEEGVLDQVDQFISELQSEVEHHLQDERRGERLRSGVHVVIAGATNAGKSSLLNTLCQRPAAIVSPIAGTTRDVVDTALDIAGFPVVLSDTAGLRDSADLVEREGVRRARQRVEQADVTLVVVDCAQIPLDQPTVSFLRDHIKTVLPSQDPKQCIVVLNKLDLLTEQRRQRLRSDLSSWTAPPSVCCVSCLTEEGLQHFLSQLQLRVQCGDPLSGGPSLTQARHRSHLQLCVSALKQFRRYRDSDLALAAEGVRLALTCVGRITGRVGPEEILDIIFKDFCIGK
uniref:TrmE-type G domain-containing protein n=1 Tax=Periophthalmus magnuspinnatus TaxID=409849 RepID=A0A3B4AN46_9GOBI